MEKKKFLGLQVAPQLLREIKKYCAEKGITIKDFVIKLVSKELGYKE